MTVFSKILIVEDESIVALDLEQRLEDMNYNVVGIAGNGIEAIKKTEKLSPDLVLMDILIKGDLNGIETAQKIRNLYNIPFIYLTGSFDASILERAKTAEPSGYVNKPFDDIEIQNAIQLTINNHQKEQILKKIS